MASTALISTTTVFSTRMSTLNPKINPLAVVVHRKRKLRGSSKATLSQFMDQASLIDALQ